MYRVGELLAKITRGHPEGWNRCRRILLGPDLTEWV